MEENKYDYNPEEGYDYENEENDAARKSLLGYRVVVIILAIILAGVSALYFNLNRQQQRDYELLLVDRDSIQSDLTTLIGEFDGLKHKNDTITAQLNKANEIVAQLQRENRWNYNKIKQYQKEVGTLRAVMKNYLRQIDSLNNINKKVSAENVTLRKRVSTANLRAEVAEERASELQNKVKQGSVLRSRGIYVTALNKNGRAVSRVKNATTLSVGFTVSANQLATTGRRVIYLRITGPEGYLLTTPSTPAFSLNGATLGYSASREIDYQNEDVAVNIFYNGSGFTPGVYKIELYTGGYRIGGTEVALK